MKIHPLLSIAILLTFLVPLDHASAKQQDGNLVKNADFSQIGSNGDPVGWYRGGYGNNERSHALIACRQVYTEADLLDPNSPNFVFRPDCPPNATHRLVTNAVRNTHIDGDTKWYFDDIKVKEKWNYKVSYAYQAYTYNAMVIVRFAMKDGSYRYQTLGYMPQQGGGNGYSAWGKGMQMVVPPKNAKSFTVFFAVTRDTDCTPETCIVMNPSYGQLSIANIVVNEVK